MKPGTLKLCLPIMAMTAQQTAASLVIPPFLDDLHFPISAIGTLISVAPFLALTARLPAGMIYQAHRARALMLASLSVLSLSTLLYIFVSTPLHFALVQAANGFSFGIATTIYLAFFVDALPPDEERHHAMGYYAGSLATGYSAGGFAAGYVADRLGYIATFKFGALLGLLGLSMFFFMGKAPSQTHGDPHKATGASPSFWKSLRSIWDPKIASVVVVALFLNMLHQIGSTFLPLYGLAVGLTLTEVGVIRGIYSLCNAITRPLSGPVVKRLGHQMLSHAGLPIQSAFIMLVPMFHHFVPLLVVFVFAGFLRALVIVSNVISMVEDVDARRVSRGVVSGIYNAAQDVGNILGPSVGGLIASLVGVAKLFLAGPLIIVALLFLSLWSCRYVKPSIRSGHS
ncbi:MAG: MFS transporter [Deltaproteobacteria bacterium]|nr:MAG: MFS transporter [Deltaproteobacteria bacterium]